MDFLISVSALTCRDSDQQRTHMPAVLAQPAADSYQEEIQQETVQYSSRYSDNRKSTPLNDGQFDRWYMQTADSHTTCCQGQVPPCVLIQIDLRHLEESLACRCWYLAGSSDSVVGVVGTATSIPLVLQRQPNRCSGLMQTQSK